MRIAVLGNAGSGKSTLSKRLSADLKLPLCEVDTFMWETGWARTPIAEYETRHQSELAKPRWVMDGMGPLGTLPNRLDRATHIIFCDLPIWQNFWLLAERQAAWQSGQLDLRPGGQETPPPTKDLFSVVWQIHNEIMPKLRDMIARVETSKSVSHLTSFDDVSAFEFKP